MSRNVSHSNPVNAASQVVLAIRERDWASLQLLLSTNPDPGGKVEPWQTAASRFLGIWMAVTAPIKSLQLTFGSRGAWYPWIACRRLPKAAEFKRYAAV